MANYLTDTVKTGQEENTWTNLYNSKKVAMQNSAVKQNYSGSVAS